MSRMLVVGQGRIGRALAMLWRLKADQQVSGRALAATDRLETLVRDVDVVVHVAGPAGEAACRADPGGAFAVHYRLMERLAAWTLTQPSRRLIVVGSLAPETGFYGPLKRAAIRATQRVLAEAGDDCLTIVEAGQVIGEGMSLHESPGVVARYITQAVTRGVLSVPRSAAVTLRVTPLYSLLQVLDRVVHVPAPHPPILAPVSEPIVVRELARMVVRLVALTYDVEPEIEEIDTPGDSYLDPDPTAEVVPVRATAVTLMGWLRTVEAKMLFAPRRRP